MKKMILILAGLCLNLSANKGGNLGAGFVLGEPVGITLKYWTVPEKVALDFVLGSTNDLSTSAYRFSDNRCYDNNYYRNNTNYCLGVSNNGGNFGMQNLHLHADYLIHNFNAIQTREQLPIYYGPGLFMDYWQNGYYLPNYQRTGGFTEFGIRGVFGISWIPRNTPFDIFFELAPILGIFPVTHFSMNAGLGGRYWF